MSSTRLGDWVSAATARNARNPVGKGSGFGARRGPRNIKVTQRGISTGQSLANDMDGPMASILVVAHKK